MTDPIGEKLDALTGNLHDPDYMFLPGDVLYDLMFSFRAEFLARKKVENVSDLKSGDGERLAGKFRKYISQKISKEDFKNADLDPTIWEGVLLDE